MTLTQQMRHTLGEQLWEYEPPLPRGIVAAVDESPESIEAFRMALEVSAARGWRLHVVSVITPSSTRNPVLDLTGELGQTDQFRLKLRTETIRNLLSEKGKKGLATYEVTIGEPARSIVSAAECRGAGLIVSGRTTHNSFERLIGNETTLHIMRSSHIPVLAVCAATQGLRQVVVATDFSNSSVKTAQVAAELMGGNGTIHLVHVDEPRDVIAGIPLHQGPSPSDIVAWFRRTSASLIGQSQLRVEPAVLSGEPVETLLEFSERIGASMIAAGSHGYSRVERMFLGSVSTTLVRRSPFPVLVARGDR
jgi:nucleotide-binding universal stress UspA family protein